MADFRTIHGDAGLSAHQLGRMGEITGGWRIERHGAPVCDVPHEIGALMLLKLLADAPTSRWAEALIQSLKELEVTS